MAWKKGKQGFRFEHSSQELNNSLKKIEGTIKEEEAKYLLLYPFFLRLNIICSKKLFIKFFWVNW